MIVFTIIMLILVFAFAITALVTAKEWPSLFNAVAIMMLALYVFVLFLTQGA